MNARHKSWPLVKICGIRSVEEAFLALENGANSVGLLVGLTHKSEDEISVATAAAIRDAVAEERPDARVVLVTHRLLAAEINALVRAVRPDAIQIHDAASPAETAALRAIVGPETELFKAIHVIGEGEAAARDAVAVAAPYAASVDAFITDSVRTDADGAVRIGGTGTRHAEGAVAALRNAFPAHRIILAGGLRPENVREAIAIEAPDGIDVNSGVEKPDGSKSPERVAAFCSAGRAIAAAKRNPPTEGRRVAARTRTA